MSRQLLIKKIVLLTVLAALMLMPAAAFAAEAPIKENLSSHIGWEVDKTIGGPAGKICTIASGHECQPGKPSSEPGGFMEPLGLAVNDDPKSPGYHDLYIMDFINRRIQEFHETGEFVSMFGWEVDKTKLELRHKQEAAHEPVTVTQAQENICTAISHDICQAGTAGTAPGQFDEMESIAIDPKTGDLYIAEFFPSLGGAERLQEFDAEGVFLEEIGKEVNATKDALVGATVVEKNVCTEHEVTTENVRCVPPEPQVAAGEHDAFNFDEADSVLTFGGPNGTLYVGESGRIQEFEEGKYKGEVSLEAVSTEERNVSTIAVGASGEIFLVYSFGTEHTNTIYRLSPAGAVISAFTLSPRRTGAIVEAKRVAVDAAGRLAVVESEVGISISFAESRGVLYGVAASRLKMITGFVDPVAKGLAREGITDLVFDDKDRLYASDWWRTESESANEVLAYTPLPVAELSVAESSGGQLPCSSGAESETDATLDCDLGGQVDPWGVSETEVWFEAGATPSLGVVTSHQPVPSKGPEGSEETPIPVTALVEGLRPNQTVDFRMAGQDHNVILPETLVSELVRANTATVPPRIVGAPSATFVKSFSAVISGELNPENTGTEYYGEYVPQTEAGQTLAASCPKGAKGPEPCEGVASTIADESSEYGEIGATFEATGLQPGTTYRYRLFAQNAAKETAVGEKGGPDIQEGTFKTVAAPLPQAESGSASSIGTTSATISGTVNPDGQPAVYTFQIGLFNGTETRFGTILSAPVGSSTVPAFEQLGLTGLQPGTTYAYRIGVSSAYGTSFGAASVFATLGLPATLVVPSPLAMLPIPPIAFPAAGKSVKSCKHGYKRDKQGKCIKTKPKKSKTKPAKKTRKATKK